MPNRNQEREFAEEIRDSYSEFKVSDSALSGAIEWIANNLSPDDVFSDNDLANWAEKNGYAKE